MPFQPGLFLGLYHEIVEAWVAFEERVRFAYGVWPPRANHDDAAVRQSYFSTLSGAYVRLTINCFEAFKEEMKAGAPVDAPIHRRGFYYELALLVRDALLPEPAHDATHRAYAAATRILADVGLKPANPMTPAQHAKTFYLYALSPDPVKDFADWLERHYQ